jgi:hypothetical protein
VPQTIKQFRFRGIFRKGGNMIKYLKNGQKVELVEETKSGYLVKHYFSNGCDIDEDTGEYQEYLTETPQFYKEIFDSPPTEVLHDEIKRLRKEVSELQKRESGATEKARQAEDNAKERLEKIKSYEGLELIEDFLNENITHFVTLNWNDYPKIETSQEKLKYRDDGEFKIRLLALYGDREGNLDWRMHYYSGGSGSSETVYPFTSYEAALKKVHEVLAKKLETIEQEKNGGRSYCVIDLVDLAKEYNFSLPDWATKERAAHKEKNRLEQIDKLINKKKEIAGKLKKLSMEAT